MGCAVTCDKCAACLVEGFGDEDMVCPRCGTKYGGGGSGD